MEGPTDSDARSMEGSGMNRVDIVALGELLVDFTSMGLSETGASLFERNAGGAPANFLAAAGACGLATQFVGCVGDDQHGRFLRRSLQKAGIGTDHLRTTDKAFTTLAFVDVDPESGEREFSFARKPGADTLVSPEDAPEGLIASCKVFHAGSLSLTDEPARSATLEALRTAREHGVLTSFDPNWRAPLWPDEETGARRMREALPFADMVKASEEEAALLTGRDDPEDAAKRIVRAGAKIAAVTLGARGCLVAWDGPDGVRLLRESGFPSSPVDTTGAGDVFWGFFVASLVAKGPRPFALEERVLRECARTANAAASLCVEAYGGIPAVPSLESVEARLERTRPA